MYIHVKVKPKSKEESFEKVKELHFVAKVKEEAKRNMANLKTKELVAKYFSIETKEARLISGHNSPSKLFSLPDHLK
jgi:uncharacterized protein YggU (UPF0235/DUF167 family)